MNKQRRAESFANEVVKHLETCNLSMPITEVVSSSYYWGMSEVIGEIESLLINAEHEDSSVANTNICKAIRNYINSVV